MLNFIFFKEEEKKTFFCSYYICERKAFQRVRVAKCRTIEPYNKYITVTIITYSETHQREHCARIINLVFTADEIIISNKSKEKKNKTQRMPPL